MRKTTLAWGLLLGMLLSGSVALGAEPKARKPGPTDKCAVCGMFVAKYPDFAAQIQTRDGKTLFFDGTKDLFTFYLNPAKYKPGAKQTDAVAMLVTSYYTLKPIDAFSAWYVIGSDVYGPMGKELIPFAREAEAKEFKKDHKGTAILRFEEISAATLQKLN